MSANDIFFAFNHLTAFLAAGAAGIVGYGFLRLSIRHSGLVGHLATGLLLMHVVVLSRCLYWSVIRPVVPRENWIGWLMWSGDEAVNLVFNLLVVLAGYHSLKALHLAIPQEIRDGYSLIGAAFYPRLRVLEVLRNRMIACWRRIRR